MKRRQRHLALPKRESKIVTERKRTVCTTIEPVEDRKDYLQEMDFNPSIYKRG